MKLSLNQRRWVMGVALAITVALVASVGGNDDSEGTVVEAGIPKSRAMHRHEGGERSEAGAIPLDGSARPQQPEEARDMFAAKSWHVEPPPQKIVVRPVAPPLPFVYIGKMIDSGNKVIVFLADQGRIYTVSEGDRINGNYRVDAVKAPSMTLTYLPLEIKQTLQIGEAN
ncbi:MAG: hypothetical protein K2P57_09175 [Burkholderiales bacterium]|nr:hypothetical protein [Burkholderiales bacterium]